MLFPEFAVGNLHDDGLDAIWIGPKAMRTREILSRDLTPICARRVQLYLNRQSSILLERADV